MLMMKAKAPSFLEGSHIRELTPGSLLAQLRGQTVAKACQGCARLWLPLKGRCSCLLWQSLASGLPLAWQCW